MPLSPPEASPGLLLRATVVAPAAGSLALRAGPIIPKESLTPLAVAWLSLAVAMLSNAGLGSGTADGAA